MGLPPRVATKSENATAATAAGATENGAAATTSSTKDGAAAGSSKEGASSTTATRWGSPEDGAHRTSAVLLEIINVFLEIVAEKHLDHLDSFGRNRVQETAKTWIMYFLE